MRCFWHPFFDTNIDFDTLVLRQGGCVLYPLTERQRLQQLPEFIAPVNIPGQW